MLVTSPRNLDEALRLSEYCDAYLVGLEGFCPKHRNLFTLEELKKLCLFKKKVIVRLDLMLFEEHIKDLDNICKELKNLSVSFYANDLGVIQILKENDLINKAIYDPLTMITNKLDASIYENMGLDAFGISLEIPVKDLITFNNMKVFSQVYGLREMFSSKRKVISLYLKSRNKAISNLDNIHLIEQTRQDDYPTYEDMYGTYIYRSYYLNYISHIKEFNFKYLWLDSLNINEDNYLTIVKTYNNYLSDKISLEDSNRILNSLSLPYSDGFMYRDSVYQKEELKNE